MKRGGDAREVARRLNGEVVTIARVVVDPRFRGMGLARRLVEELQRRLGTKVRLVERGNGKGTIEVDFFSYDDLERLMGLIRR